MTSKHWFSPALLLLASLSLGACAVDAHKDDETSLTDDRLLAAYAAVEAGRCTPDCTGRACGLDPICGVSCGECRTGQSCDEDTGQCQAECVPDCSGRACGLDPVCGVSCGACGKGSSCDLGTGTCEPEKTDSACRFRGWKKRRHHRR